MARTAAPKNSGLVAVGRVTKPHGIRGEFCVEYHADSPLLFAPGKTIFLAVPLPGAKPGAAPARPRPFEVATLREHGDRLLVMLKGMTDRNAVDNLRGVEVLVPESELPEPDEGEVYLHELFGCQVVLADGTPVGVFEDILDTPASQVMYDTWVIRAPGVGGKQGPEVLFPAVPEFILELDPEAGLIRIDPPPGLVELYLGEGQKSPKKPEESEQ